MSHKGEILEKVVRSRRNNISALGRELDYDRASIYRHFSDPDLEDGIILKYAKALKYNFNYEFPNLGSYQESLQEPLVDYKPMSISEALKEVDIWKAKYIDLLEKHNALLNDMVNQDKTP